MDANRPLCGHLLTHLDPAIEQLLGEKLNIAFSGINEMTVDGFREFGQLGLDAKWLLDNIEKIEEIFGQIIDSQVKWNQAVAKLTKKGFSAIEGFDKNAVDAVISMRQRESKIGEGNDKIANAEGFFSQLRKNNNEIDRVRLTGKLATSFAELEAAKNAALSEPAIQAAFQKWRSSLGLAAKQAKKGLQFGQAANTHPDWNGESAQLTGYPQNDYVGYLPAGNSYQSGRSNYSNSANNRGSVLGSIGNGIKKLGRFFGGK